MTERGKSNEVFSPHPVLLVSLVEFLSNSDCLILARKPTRGQAQAIAQEAARVTKEKGVGFCGNDDKKLPFHSDGTTIDTVAHGFEHIVSAALGAEMAMSMSQRGNLRDKEGVFLVSLDMPGGRRITQEEVESSIRAFNEFVALHS